MMAYLGDKSIKEKYVARCTDKKESKVVMCLSIVLDDQWKDGKYQPFGTICESFLGIPANIGWVADSISLDLPRKYNQSWPARFLAAVPVSADLSGVWPVLCVELLSEKGYGLTRWIEESDVRELASGVVEGYALTAAETGAEYWTRQISQACLVEQRYDQYSRPYCWANWIKRAAGAALEPFLAASVVRLAIGNYGALGVDIAEYILRALEQENTKASNTLIVGDKNG